MFRNKKRILAWIAVFGITVCAFYATRLLLLTDLSTLPIDKKSNPDFKPKTAFSREPVYLISYADGHEVFFQNQHALAQSTLGRGVDVIINYRRSLLDPSFVEENKQILGQKAGAGYWLWKPWVILNTMKNAPDNSVIIYADCGSVIRSSLEPLIELTKEYPIILSHYEEPRYGTPRTTVKREVFIQLNCDNEQCYKGKQIWAGFIILRNNPQTRTFIEQWLTYAKNPQLLLPGPSSKPELEGFANHQHDQAILNVLVNRNPAGIHTIPYDSVLTKKYVVWKHRRPGAKPSDPLFLKESLIPDYDYTSTRKLDYCFLNAPWMKWIRSKIYEEQ